MMRVLIIILSTLLFRESFSQITLGPRYGLNIADVRESGAPFAGDDDLFNPKLSYHFGVMTKIPTTDRVFLQGELLYSRKGSRLRDQLGNRVNLRLNYVTLPLLIGLQFNDLSVLFGAESGLVIGENKPKSSFDFGIVGEVDYYVGQRNQVALRFVQGVTLLNNLGISDTSGLSGFSQLRNQLWQLSIIHELVEY